MNEQIRELAEQAGFENGHQDRNGNSLSGELEKFAELIVRECANIAREVGTSTNTEDFALDRCYEIEAKIEQHFGVKE